MPLEIKVKTKGNPSMKMKVKSEKKSEAKELPKRGQRTVKNKGRY
jgi:hypothetical protein